MVEAGRDDVCYTHYLVVDRASDFIDLITETRCALCIGVSSCSLAVWSKTARDGAGDGPCVRSSDGEKSIRQAESIRLANGTRVLSIRLL